MTGIRSAETTIYLNIPNSKNTEDMDMKLISVLIPTYNSSKTIRRTLNSVFRQTVPPDEILVVDDGSSDNTLSLLEPYKPKVTVFQERHGGVSNARNFLCEKATGQLLAFLDHDDIWHVDYLKVQWRSFKTNPHCVGFFTGHVNFQGYGDYQWDTKLFNSNPSIEIISPLDFFIRYNQSTGAFGSMSYFCLPQRVLSQIGGAPFNAELKGGADDSYLMTKLALTGSVVYISSPLVAYRIIKEAASENRLNSLKSWVHIFELLEPAYRTCSDEALLTAFRLAFASKRRMYAKKLMGAGRVSEARRQIRLAFANTSGTRSRAKSIAFLFLTYLPERLQPRWPPSYREL